MSPTATAPSIDWPEWVLQGSGFAYVDGTPVFQGVGVMSGFSNQALSRATADNRARAALALRFQQFASEVVGVYYRALAAEHPGEELSISQCVHDVNASALGAVEVVERWTRGEDVHYALARLRLEVLLTTIDNMESEAVDTRARATFHEHSTAGFAALAAQRTAHLSELTRGDTCAVSLEAHDIDDCKDDLGPIAAGGTLAFDCSGGAATARFGALELTGTAIGNYILIEHRDETRDGDCSWTRTTRIEGPVDQLQLSYTSGADRGQEGCREGCREYAELNVPSGP